MKNYITFTKKEAKRFGKALYNNWHINLKEKFAFFRYRAFSRKINKDARNNNDNAIVEIISKALKRSFINQEIVVKRETNKDFLSTNGTNFDDVKKDDILIEKGFTSTFLYQPKWIFKGTVRLKIRVPKGINGAYINPIFLGFQFEHELLLNKNMKYLVEDKRYEGKILYLDLLCLGYL